MRYYEQEQSGVLIDSAETIHPLPFFEDLPSVFPSPFNNQPHPLAAAAARHLQQQLPELTQQLHDFTAPKGGKMLGVLVVQTADHQLAYLAAFSGMLGGRHTVEGFVPPLFNESQYHALLNEGQQALDAIADEERDIADSKSYQAAIAQLQCVQQQVSATLSDIKEQQAVRKQYRSEQRIRQPHDTALIHSLNKQSREDKRNRQAAQRAAEVQLAAVQQPVSDIKNRLQQLQKARRRYSAQLQKRLFDEYTIRSTGADAVTLRSLFADRLPPGGAGDCAAVKLLNTAILQQLKPVCLAEFWWGAEAGLRQHGRFYPACRSKCRPILPHMLAGLDVEQPAFEKIPEFAVDQPTVIYEDDAIVVVNKPAGMLSVPGHAVVDSVETRLRQRYPITTNPTLLLHRLDQPTSGLLVAAKNAPSHKHLQLQFQKRKVHKRYVARLAGIGLPSDGEIRLPLRVDLEDRPRQLVCYDYGKSALTKYRVLSEEAQTTLVEFIPVTGRTHQLRVHAAHPLGLNTPILGDELYGAPALRLHLHAQQLTFTHPVTGENMSFAVPAPFIGDSQFD